MESPRELYLQWEKSSWEAGAFVRLLDDGDPPSGDAARRAAARA